METPSGRGSRPRRVRGWNGSRPFSHTRSSRSRSSSTTSSSVGCATRARRPRVTSFVMWENFLRFVGDGITLAELPDAAGILESPHALRPSAGWSVGATCQSGPHPGRGATVSAAHAGSAQTGPSSRPRPAASPRRSGVPSPTRSRSAGRSASGAAAVGELRRCLEPIAGQPELSQPRLPADCRRRKLEARRRCRRREA